MVESRDPGPTRCAALLAYHKIGEPPPGTWKTWNYVPEDVFLGHLDLLHREGYEIIDLDTLLSGLQDPQPLPPRAALLTFDDGFASMVHTVLPILDRRGHPAVLFVPTRFIGGTNRFDDGNEPEERICDWGQLRELQQRGVSIQSHGVSHRAFSGLGVEEQEEEFRRSREILESHLGTRVEVFSFPFSDNGRDPDQTDLKAEEAGYRAACLYKGGALSLPVSNPFRLTRMPMGPDSDLLKMLPHGRGSTHG